MHLIYQASHYAPGRLNETYKREDFPTEKEARAAVEKARGGNVVKFIRTKNLPGCLPEYVDKSISLDVHENGVWRSVNIHGC